MNQQLAVFVRLFFRRENASSGLGRPVDKNRHVKQASKPLRVISLFPLPPSCGGFSYEKIRSHHNRLCLTDC